MGLSHFRVLVFLYTTGADYESRKNKQRRREKDCRKEQRDCRAKERLMIQRPGYYSNSKGNIIKMVERESADRPNLFTHVSESQEHLFSVASKRE